VNNIVRKTRDKHVFVSTRSKLVWTFRLRNSCQLFHMFYLRF